MEELPYFVELITVISKPAYKLYQRGPKLSNGYGHPLWLMTLTDGDMNFEANVNMIVETLNKLASEQSS